MEILHVKLLHVVSYKTVGFTNTVMHQTRNLRHVPFVKFGSVWTVTALTLCDSRPGDLLGLLQISLISLGALTPGVGARDRGPLGTVIIFCNYLR